MTDNNATLIPCPFCGGEAEVTLCICGGVKYKIRHNMTRKCPASLVDLILFDTEAEAIATWNTRV